MCLDIRRKGNEKFPRHYISKKDRIVYKVVNPSYNEGSDFKSLYLNFFWKYGFHYYLTPHTKKQEEALKERLFNCKNGFVFEYAGDIFGDRFKVSEGLHCFVSCKDARKHLLGKNLIVKFILPKGAIYYVDSFNKNLIVTNQLILPHKS